MSDTPQCRFCNTPLATTFVDLGMSPLCETFLTQEQCNHRESFYPLHVLVCDQCLLVQLQEYVAPEEIFTEYAYFSSYSQSWLDHAKAYTEKVTQRFKLTPENHIVEIASNDGYLLQNFVEAGIPVTGIEPAENVAKAAIEKGVNTLSRFFGTETARDLVNQKRQADLLIGNNVLAHVPDINDFTAGLQTLLKPDGVLTMEFPHLQRLMKGNQFDTIYHEHYSYLAFTFVNKLFTHHGLQLFDVEQLPSHGGSLRVYATRATSSAHEITLAVQALLDQEEQAGFYTLEHHLGFEPQVQKIKNDLLTFLIQAKAEGKSVVGYGAPGKGNTLLNYCGIRTDYLDYTVDRNPYKHGRFCSGTHIPIHPVEKITETQPDYLLILPWNLKKEITAQMATIREWGGQFIVPIPELEIC